MTESSAQLGSARLLGKSAVVTGAAAGIGRATAELFAKAMTFINGLLPPSTGAEGDRLKLGRDSQSAWAPSSLTTRTYRAAIENNEM